MIITFCDATNTKRLRRINLIGCDATRAKQGSSKENNTERWGTKRRLQNYVFDTKAHIQWFLERSDSYTLFSSYLASWQRDESDLGSQYIIHILSTCKRVDISFFTSFIASSSHDKQIPQHKWISNRVGFLNWITVGLCPVFVGYYNRGPPSSPSIPSR